MAVWTPLLRGDSRSAAQKASAYLPDSRVQHFWDLWSYANRTYAQQFDLPVAEAWDLFVLYQPQVYWNRGNLPEPTIWMQHRNLDKGIPYSQAKLEAELQKWVQ